VQPVSKSKLKRCFILLVAALCVLALICVGLRGISDAAVFRRCVGFEKPATIADLRVRSNYWTIDPQHFLRFYADTHAIQRLIAMMDVEEDSPARNVADERRLHAKPMPSWWTPQEIANPRTWTKDDGKVLRRLRIDEDSGLVYFEFFYY
jgi:hypothetical protein